MIAHHAYEEAGFEAGKGLHNALSGTHVRASKDARQQRFKQMTLISRSKRHVASPERGTNSLGHVIETARDLAICSDDLSCRAAQRKQRKAERGAQRPGKVS